ncbi:MAG: aldo/keto reductase [Gemmataceae bacterium]
MQTRRLGDSDLDITPLGIGAWAMGGGNWAFAWGNQDDADSVAAIRAGLDAGINWIDTAAVYGLGHAEEVVAKALDGMAKKPLVFTKCARIWGPERQIAKSLKAVSIRRECEDSLRRLKVDCIDLYQVHWPEPDEDVEEGWETMVRLKDEGKVRWIGVSNFSEAQLERIRRIARMTSLQPPYSLVKREIERDVLPYCAQHNVGVIVYSPMRNGLLSGAMTRARIAALPDDDWRKSRNPDFQEPLLTQNLKLVGRLQSIAARYNRTAGEAAIAWTLRRPEVTGAIVGLRRADQVAGVIGASDWRLTDAEVAEIEGPPPIG